MRASILTGICVERDAISDAALATMRRLEEHGEFEARLFTGYCEYQDLESTVVSNSYQLSRNSWFASSDLLIVHFGIYYELFNILPLVARNTKIVCVFHNITPRELLGENREIADKSFTQACNMAWADYVVCDSATNLRVLRELGIRTPASVVPIEVPLPSRIDAKPSASGGRPKVLFVGRLVEAKGVLDLLEAVSQLLIDDSRIEVDLTVVGNLGLSDPAVVSAVRLLLETLGRMYQDRFTGRLEGNVTNERRDELLADADVFILPSYHEGFGIPVIEAFGHGCKVVTYDNSNLPSVVADVGTLVETGDIAGLQDALRSEVQQVTSVDWRANGGFQEFASRAREHARQFAPDTVSAEFADVIRTVLN